MKKAILITAASCACLVGATWAATLPVQLQQTPAADNDTPASPVRGMDYISQADFIRASESTVNGVVSVKSYATASRRQQQMEMPEMMDPFFEFFFGSPQAPRRRQQVPQQEEPKQRQIGLGSGVIISADGYIVTNNHVIENADRLEVTLNDNQNFEATVVGADPNTDLALIKIDAKDLHTIPMGKSEDLRVGEWVLAVGNPFGFTSTVTSGIVSAKARNISSATGAPQRGGIESYIQTDAAVNSGNSGGALVNLRGELVGINAAIYSQTGTYAGMSFAIPTSIVQKVVDDLKQYGVVQRAFLGVTFAQLTPELVAEKKIEGVTNGVLVMEISDRSAALQAGLKQGDVITQMDNHNIRNTADLQEAMTTYSPGDKVVITYWRGGKKFTTTATLRNNKGEFSRISSKDGSNALGAQLQALKAETASRLEINGGVEVESLEEDGLLAQAGVRKGFIILAVNGQRVTDPKQIDAILKSVAKSSSSHDKALFLSGIYPTGKTAYYAVPVE